MRRLGTDVDGFGPGDRVLATPGLGGFAALEAPGGRRTWGTVVVLP